MSAAVASVQLFSLAGLTFLAAGALAAAAVVGLWRRPLLRLAPKARHGVLASLALLPLLSAVALSFTVSLPSLVSLAFPELDHCATHDDGHAHLCFVHLPSAPVSVTALCFLTFCGTYLGLRCLLLAVPLYRGCRLVRALASTGTPLVEGVTLIESERPLCMAAGLGARRILVSRGLWAAIGGPERAVVLAHERAHLRRRDALVTSALRLCAPLHVPSVARWLARELEIAAEQVCDEAAAAEAGDRMLVAETILRVEQMTRAAGPAPRLAGAGFGSCAVVRRVEALLAEPSAPGPQRLWRPGVVLGTLLLILGADTLHHTTESLLSLVAQ